MHIHHEPSNTAASAPRFPVAQNVARRMSSREIAATLQALNGDVSSFARISPRALAQKLGVVSDGR